MQVEIILFFFYNIMRSVIEFKGFVNMNSNRMTEGVGKKIVEALKQQSDVEIIPVKDDTPEYMNFNADAPQPSSIQSDLFNQQNQNMFEDQTNNMATPFNFNNNNINNNIDNALNNTMLNFQSSLSDVNNSAVEELELPANVAVLRKLITKIPSGVSKQTGAMIIKQTMEALGISMTSVLQEAQQVQERLTQSVRECQTNVLEYKKQINILEVQAQKYQRQFAAVNDIISLFIQTNN